MDQTESIGSACPSDEELLRFTSRDLAKRRAAAVERHVGSCDACRAAIREIAGALHQYRSHTRHVTADARPWETFRTALAIQDEALHERRAVTLRHRWSWAAAAAVLAIAAVSWYRYTEVPLSAETVLTRAIAHEQQRHESQLSTVAFRQIGYSSHAKGLPAHASAAPGGAGASDRAIVTRELTQRLAPYGFDAGSPLSPKHFQRWRHQIRRRDDRVVQLTDDLIKVSTVTGDADAAIREGEIIVHSESYEPIAQTWRFADGFEAEVNRVVDPPAAPPEPTTPEHVVAAVPPSNARPDLTLIEVQARAALHRLGVPVSGAIEFKRAGDRVVIDGTLPANQHVAAVTSYAGSHPNLDARVRLAEPATFEVPIAHAPAFQTWLEEMFPEDTQQRARFVPRAADLTQRLEATIQELSTLAQRYPPHRVARMSSQARADLHALASAQYRDATAAYDALARHLATLVPDPPTISSADMPKDWPERTARLGPPTERLRVALAQWLNRADLLTTDDLRVAADEALRPPLGELASALTAASLPD